MASRAVSSPSPNPAPELQPASLEELSQVVAGRFAQSAPLEIVGGGTSCFRRETITENTARLSTVALQRIVDYPARDMTITVEAGLRVAELQRVLREQGQSLPLDIPQAAQATIGGAMALNVSGPGRYGHGTFRDYVIGVRAVDGQGRLFAAGGRVVKNVAGYDLCKLLVGSRGELAVIGEITFKLRPLPETRRMVWLTLPDWSEAERALQGLATTATRPVAVEVLGRLAADAIARQAGRTPPVSGVVLCVGLEGTDRETQWQIETLEQELAARKVTARERVEPEESGALWSALTEFSAAGDRVTLQATVLPSQGMELAQLAETRGLEVQVHAGNGVVIGRLPESVTGTVEEIRIVEELQRVARSGGGSVHGWAPEWSPEVRSLLSPGLTPLERRVKGALDPRGILNG